MGLFSGKTKTYVSASCSNLLGDSLEARYVKGAIIESVLGDLPSMSDHIVNDTLIPGAGTAYKNFAHWAEKVPYEGRPFNQHLGLGQPYVTITPQPEPEKIEQYLIDNWNYEPEEKEEQKTFKFKARNPDYKPNSNTEEFIEVSISSKAKVKSCYTLVHNSSKNFDPVDYGKYFIWKNHLDRPNKEILMSIVTGETTYEVSLASMTNGEDGTVGGTDKQAVVSYGYTYPEVHTKPDPNNPSSEIEYTEEVFYNQESILIDSYNELKKEHPNISNNEVFICIIIYLYKEYEIDAYEMDGEYIKVGKDKKPIKIEGSTMPARFYYEVEKEDYNEEVHKIIYSSNINIEDVEACTEYTPYSLIKDNPSKNPFYSKPISVKFGVVPYVCARNDKEWINENNNKFWTKLNTKALRKLTKNNKYYSKLLDGLYKSNGVHETAWIYVVQGIPINLTQLNYVSRYALQLFKMIVFPDYLNTPVGTPIYRQIGRGCLEVHGNFNFHQYNHFSSIIYQMGTGKNPVDPSKKAGSIFTSWFRGHLCFCRIFADGSWEYTGVSGFKVSYLIKNGKSHYFTNLNYGGVIWDKKKRKRTYSDVILPLFIEVAKKMPLAHWTDCVQYANNCVCTSYKIVKTKWYQTGLFKFIFTVVSTIVIVVAVIFGGPAGMAGALGLAGVAASVGSFIFGALIAVSVSYIAAVATNLIISPILKMVFGDKFGSLLASTIQVVVSIVGTAYLCGITLDWGFFTKPTVLLSLGVSATSTVTTWQFQEKMRKLKEQQKARFDHLESVDKHNEAVLASEHMSFYNPNYRPSFLSQTLLSLRYGAFTSPVETCDSFLRRTLPDEFDLIERTYDMVDVEYLTSAYTYLPTEIV